MRRITRILIVLALSATATSLAAQSQGSVAAYTALVVSPSGGLPATLTNVLLGRAATSPEFGVRYGQWNEAPITTRDFGATARFAVGSRSNMGATAGYVNPNCGGCEGSWMMGMVAEQRYALASQDSGPNATTLVYALTEDLGFAKPRSSSGHAIALSVHAPTATVFHRGALAIAPFISPGYGFGQIDDGSQTEGGVRPMLGGGIGIASLGSGFGLTVSAERVMTEGARTVFGASLNMLGR